MLPLASYGARARGRRFDIAVYEDRRGYFLRVYDGRARDLVPPVHLDPAVYGRHPDGSAWAHATWRAWLRDGAERLLFRVGLLRLGLVPAEEPAPATDRGALRGAGSPPPQEHYRA